MNVSFAVLLALTGAKEHNTYTRRLVQMPQIPESFDWRQKNLVGPVQVQGHCAACWAFSAAGSIDYLVKQKDPEASVDVQALLDCTPHTLGCEGGVMGDVFQYKGIYPLTSKQHYDGKVHRCQETHKGVRVTDYKVIMSNPEKYLDYIVHEFGPTSVAIDSRGLGSYRGGTITMCGKDPNHAVIVVGYTPEYWIIKNSFGTTWGDNGYAYISREGNTCGINTYAAVATEIEMYK